jgi:hypothetical protein
LRFFSVNDAFKEYDELVSSEAGNGVGIAQAALEPVGALDQQLIADLVTVRVVHDLETVEVDEQHCDCGPDP